MKTLVYLSTSVNEFDEDELSKLLEVARERNKAKNISGMLLFLNGLFIQVLEGGNTAVDALFNKIRFDNRHKNVLKLYEEEIEERIFDFWSMAYAKSTKEELNEFGYFTLDEIKEIIEGVASYETIKILKSILENNVK